MGETMTNNPKIDRVSQDTLTITLRLVTRELETLANGSAIQRHKAALTEIRALLDAPAVERQDDHSKSTAPRYDTIVIRGAKGNTVPKEVDGGEVVSWSQGHELAAFDALEQFVKDLADGDHLCPEAINKGAQSALELMNRRRDEGWDADE